MFVNSRGVGYVLLLIGSWCIGCDANPCSTDGWFGTNCQYKCHCEHDTPCDHVTGSCVTCDNGWFGPACQYESLPYASSDGLSRLSSDTCNYVPHDDITATLETPHPITWLRVQASSPLSDEIRVTYTLHNDGDEGAIEPIVCPSGRTAQVDDHTVDISCPTSSPVSTLTLSGAGFRNLCSLHISGGRNIALNGGSASQSSTYSESTDTIKVINEFSASNAIDGDIPGPTPSFEPLSTGCTHTLAVPRPSWWSVSFQPRSFHVHRFVIYNRRHGQLQHPNIDERLVGFTLKAYSNSGDAPFVYTDPNPTGKDIYSIVTPYTGEQGIDRVAIVLPENSRENFLTLCEVLMFGDSVCEPGTYGLECNNRCNCATAGEACFVSTGGCPSGCAPGYTGEDCQLECPYGKHGSECQNDCSRNCKDGNGHCNHVSGSCTNGCKPGYTLADCTEECSSNRYGQDCAHVCPRNCAVNSTLGERSCSLVSGACFECEPGYVGEFCQLVCPVGFFGLGCNTSCSLECPLKDSVRMCGHVSGTCFQYDDAENTSCSSWRGWMIFSMGCLATLIAVLVLFFIYCRRSRQTRERLPDTVPLTNRQQSSCSEREKERTIPGGRCRAEPNDYRNSDDLYTAERGDSAKREDAADNVYSNEVMCLAPNRTGDDVYNNEVLFSAPTCNENDVYNNVL